MTLRKQHKKLLKQKSLLRTDKAAKYCKVKYVTVRQWVTRNLLMPAKFAIRGGTDDWNFFAIKDLKEIKILRATYGRKWTSYVN